MDRESAIAAAVLLERVANGEMDASAALKEWPDEGRSDTVLDVSWHDLSHFAVDVDIRTKDQRYAAYQVPLLLKRAKQIRERYETP